MTCSIRGGRARHRTGRRPRRPHSPDCSVVAITVAIAVTVTVAINFLARSRAAAVAARAAAVTACSRNTTIARRRSAAIAGRSGLRHGHARRTHRQHTQHQQRKEFSTHGLVSCACCLDPDPLSPTRTRRRSTRATAQQITADCTQGTTHELPQAACSADSVAEQR
jgi:hypothetical protein